MWPFGKKSETAPPTKIPAPKHARADLLWRQGSKLLGQKKYAKAVESMREALELEPSRLEGRLNLGAALFLTGQAEEAITHLRYVLAFDPQNTSALLNLAAAYDANGQLDESIQTLEKVVADRPQWRDAHYNLAVAYYKRKSYDEAATALRQELTLNPQHEAARTLLNEIHLMPRRKEPEVRSQEPDSASNSQIPSPNSP